MLNTCLNRQDFGRAWSKSADSCNTNNITLYYKVDIVIKAECHLHIDLLLAFLVTVW